MLYFAYGSNMSAAQMAERCPGAVAESAACLIGHALVFDRYSERRQGYVADIVNRAGAETWGVLWRVTEAQLESLDRFEGVASGAYRRISARVSTPDGAERDAIAYQVVHPGPEGAPSPEYASVILEGAREHRLPPDYVWRLELIAERALVARSRA